MGIKKQIGYSYGDLTIVPKCISEISSRSECNSRYSDGKFPIFTAPMSSVIGIENFSYWDSCGIIPILPRTSLPDWKDKLDFIVNNDKVLMTDVVVTAEIQGLLANFSDITVMTYSISDEGIATVTLPENWKRNTYRICFS